LLSRPVSDALAALLLSPPLRTSISPPFPYTTLFRSDDRGGAHRGAQPAVPELDGDPGARGTGGACGRTQRVRDPARRPDTARREPAPMPVNRVIERNRIMIGHAAKRTLPLILVVLALAAVPRAGA